MAGWIKLHRRLTEKGYYRNSKFVHLWIHLLMKANHEPKEFLWNGSMITVNEGQFVAGRKQLAQETGISETSVERILRMLENEQQIGQQKTSRCRLISILNWREYQLDGQRNGQLADNRRTTGGHKQEVKNEKNEKKEDTSVLEHWNAIATKNGLPTILKLSDKRKRGVEARIRDPNFDLAKIEQEIEQSDFLRGSTGWRCDFDFVFLSANNFLKILEGNYRNGTRKGGQLTDDQKAERDRKFEESLRRSDTGRGERSGVD